MNKIPDYTFKLILIGDMAVGKSSLLRQFTESKFKQDHDLTIGVEFSSKEVLIGDTLIKLQVWDTVLISLKFKKKSGQESFQSVTRLYYRAAAGAVMVFDITKRQTFLNIQNWHRQALDNGNQQMQFLLVGNKTDLEQNRQVSYHEAQMFAQENQCQFIETSACDGTNVEYAFMELAHKIHQLLLDNPDMMKSGNGIKTSKILNRSQISETSMSISVKPEPVQMKNKEEEKYVACKVCC